MRNPFRTFNAPVSDKGERVSRRADKLQQVARAGASSQAEILTSLGYALGREIGEVTPQTSVDNLLHEVYKGARGQAYLAAHISPELATELPRKHFDQLAARVADVAVANAISNDAICAAAKALGVIVAFTARREGSSPDELLKYAQEAVAEFTKEAMTETEAWYSNSAAIREPS